MRHARLQISDVRSFFRVLAVAALAGSAAPLALAHWEGVEAADPSTPSAVLRLDSAAAGYTQPDVTRVSWRALFEERQSTDAHSDHEPTHEAPADAQQ